MSSLLTGCKKLKMMDTDKCYGRCMRYNDRRRGYTVSESAISRHYVLTRSTMAVRHQVLQNGIVSHKELWA